MNKPYLLIAGADYYPDTKTGNWIGCFETEKEAQEELALRRAEEYNYLDWATIVDLREWTK